MMTHTDRLTDATDTAVLDQPEGMSYSDRLNALREAGQRLRELMSQVVGYTEQIKLQGSGYQGQAN
jgi:hypothetical protein